MASIRKLLEEYTELDVLLAFQPIYARNLDVAAFELLLGQQGGAGASITNLHALSEVMAKTYACIYQKGTLQLVPSVLKVSPQLLLEAALPDLPKNQYILEISGNSDITPELVDHAKKLARSGHRLALSAYHPDKPELKPLLDIIHIVKLDVGTLGLDQILQHLGRLKAHNLDMLADNLQDPNQFRQCLDAGFKYFRGDLLGKPQTGSGRALGNNKLLLFQLLSELQNPDTTVGALEEIAIKDANLTYRFLKLVNSATYGFSKEIENLSHAMAMMGTEQIRRYISMFLIEGYQTTPEALMRNMLIRGRMCEIIAELTDQPRPISYFIVGLLSQLDVLVDIPMEDLMKQVQLNQTIKDALLERKGIMGAILIEVEHYENGEFHKLTGMLERSFYELAYRHSSAWALQIQQVMRS